MKQLIVFRITVLVMVMMGNECLLAQTIRQPKPHFDNAGYLICTCDTTLTQNYFPRDEKGKNVAYNAQTNETEFCYFPCPKCGKAWNVFYRSGALSRIEEDFRRGLRKPKISHICDSSCYTENSDVENHQYTNCCQFRKTIYVYVKGKKGTEKVFVVEWGGQTPFFNADNRVIDSIKITHDTSEIPTYSAEVQ
ncbi:MAG: hypothetical protein Q4E32_02640 [Bacteroidales bacterium]|nr:hypothetical protein [Bacteroidales bacterium]